MDCKVLKSIFVVLLFVLYVWKFGYPSCARYLSAGMTVERNLAHRSSADLPGVTFCALNNKTLTGWKGDVVDYDQTIASDCPSATTVGQILDCIKNETFSLSETISTGDSQVWTQEFLDSMHGKKTNLSHYIYRVSQNWRYAFLLL